VIWLLLSLIFLATCTTFAFSSGRVKVSAGALGAVLFVAIAIHTWYWLSSLTTT
jgi:hypothetical protein